MPSRPGTLAVLRNPVFTHLLLSNFAAAIGTWLYVAAAAWIMLDLTGSPFLAGLASGTTFIPRLVLAVPIGAFIDLYDRRLMVVAGYVIQSAAAITAGSLYLSHRLAPGTLIAATLGIGVGQALATPAYRSAIQDVVSRDGVAAGIALEAGSINVARAIGPAIGGFLIAAGRTGPTLVVTGAVYLLPCLPAWRIPRSRREQETAPELVGAAMRTGLRFVRDSPALLRVMTVVAVFALGSVNIQALMAPAAQDRGLGARGYGLLYACFGVGAIVGALLTRWLNRSLRERVLPAGMVAFAVGGVIFAVVRLLAVAAGGLVLAGAAWVVVFSTLGATAQLIAPLWVRGRVVSLHEMSFAGTMPLGAALAGLLAGWAGTAVALGVCSVFVAGVALLAHRLRVPTLESIASRSPATARIS